MTNETGLRVLEEEIIRCRRCPRLVEYREKVAKEKRRAFREWTYWGRPVPGFGDPRAKLFILGLAPGAHGSNRTGRMFTGDRSGEFLYAALHQAGFANQATWLRPDDGLELKNALELAADLINNGTKGLNLPLTTRQPHLVPPPSHGTPRNQLHSAGHSV